MTARQMTVFTVIALLSWKVALLSGHRILLLPSMFPSHVRQFATLGNFLVEDGHEVYMGLAETFPPMDFIVDSKVQMIKHLATYEDIFSMDKEKFSAMVQRWAIVNDMAATYRENDAAFENMCINALIDDNFFRTLAELNFDLAVVDSCPLTRCLLILPYDLDIPFVGVTGILEPWLSRNPGLPSFVPSNILGKRYTDKMSFFERLFNVWQTIDWYAAPRMNMLDDSILKKHIRNKEKINVNDILLKASLFFIDVDPVLDYPRPVMPNEINIGGISLKPVKPLPNDLKDFMDKSEEGVIVMTFGANSFDLTTETVRNYLNAFSQVKYNVIWKYHQDLPFQPPNVKTAKWLPQNDLLAHPNTKMFVTHCGNSGQFEALYHGVPMIGLPIFADQVYNCKRMEAHAYGICLHSIFVKTKELVGSIQEIANNDTYAKNIQHASEIYRDSPQSAHEKFVFWINHVLKYGGKHLHSHALDMPWYQYLMLDIFVFVFATISLIILIVGIAVSRLIRYQTSK